MIREKLIQHQQRVEELFDEANIPWLNKLRAHLEKYTNPSNLVLEN